MRVGIVGLGTIGQALAKAIDRGEIAAQLSVVHSRTRDKAQAFASTLRRVDAVTIPRANLPRVSLERHTWRHTASTSMRLPRKP